MSSHSWSDGSAATYDVTVTHYEVLGVASDAPADVIRRAYLTLARRHHPDFLASSGASGEPGGDPGERMREINLAWQVLGDDQGRAAYDRSIGLRDDDGPVSAGPIIRQPSSEFRPYFPVDEDDDDDWRYEPDEGDPATVPPRFMLMAPPALLILGVALLALSLVLEESGGPLVAFGVMSLGFAVLLFIGTPVLAMFRSQSAEDRAERRR